MTLDQQLLMAIFAANVLYYVGRLVLEWKKVNGR